MTQRPFEPTQTLLFYFFVFVGTGLIHSCSTVKTLATERDVNQILNQSEVFSEQFTGFSLYDIAEGSFIANYNATLKFTPASNTKLLTAYVTLRSFEDSIPSFFYTSTRDRLIARPLGDPTFLHPDFADQPALDLLKGHSAIQIAVPRESLPPYQPGWAWEDYIYRFQPEASWWPIYENSVRIKKRDDRVTVYPDFFEDYVDILRQKRPGELVARERSHNLFTAYIENDTADFERVIPFVYSHELLEALLSDTLKVDVEVGSFAFTPTDTLYSQDTKTTLAQMLKPSDNFLADQLLVMAAAYHGHADVEPFLTHVKNEWLPQLTDMVWVDGSGLSRYNLISPVDQVRLLIQCEKEFGWETMQQILPQGGEGTLKGRFEVEEGEPSYLFAKTGTLSNNHNLTGYLITHSGKRLIFSLMANHYTRPTAEVKQAMEEFLLEVRNAY